MESAHTINVWHVLEPIQGLIQNDGQHKNYCILVLHQKMQKKKKKKKKKYEKKKKKLKIKKN